MKYNDHLLRSRKISEKLRFKVEVAAIDLQLQPSLARDPHPSPHERHAAQNIIPLFLLMVGLAEGLDANPSEARPDKTCVPPSAPPRR
jgi:hypothetical protein